MTTTCASEVTYKIPKLMDDVIRTFSFFFIFNFQSMIHGSTARMKSAAAEVPLKILAKIAG